MKPKYIKSRTYPKDLTTKIEYIYSRMRELSPKDNWKFAEIYTDYKDCDKLKPQQIELIDKLYQGLKDA